MNETPKSEDIPHIVADRKRYNELLYTPLAEACEELERRRQDIDLEGKIMKLLGGNIPEPLREKPKAVISRNVMSPNYEVRRFTKLIAELGTLEPLYWEYTADKFTSNNQLKRMLGKLYFIDGRGRNNGLKKDLVNVINFSASDGKRFSTLQTLWNQNFVEFHHQLFDACHQKISHTFFDSSRWLNSYGKNAEAYYQAFLLLFVRHAILFENVLLTGQESDFTTRVFLPTFLSIYRRLGLKPLIVALEPTDIESSNYWMCYPGSDRQYVKGKMKPSPDDPAFVRRKFFIKNTRKYGRGVFAAHDIAKGEIVHVLDGETMSHRDVVERVNSGKENIDDPLQVGKRTYIDLDKISRTFNHSCDPNAALRNRSELFAIKDILKGSEITYDYSLTIAPTEWKMRCVCGVENCRKVLGDVLSIPKATRTRYRKLGAMQDYMKKLLGGIERDGTYRMPAYEIASLKSVKRTSNL